MQHKYSLASVQNFIENMKQHKYMITFGCNKAPVTAGGLTSQY